jgi:hypothetical protein
MSSSDRKAAELVYADNGHSQAVGSISRGRPVQVDMEASPCLKFLEIIYSEDVFAIGISQSQHTLGQVFRDKCHCAESRHAR